MKTMESGKGCDLFKSHLVIHFYQNKVKIV